MILIQKVSGCKVSGC